MDRILRTGYRRNTNVWRAANDAIADEVEYENCLDINLSEAEFPPGATYRFGETFVTFVCGFDQPLTEWGLSQESHKRNAISIMVRLQYRGRSILFCGDAVGRHENDPDSISIATEGYAVDMSAAIPIQSDVMIAPHHGADNANSVPFIEAVNPTYVIFSAGHRHDHPRNLAVQRYVNHGVDVARIFRTDLGDDEGQAEWPVGRVQGVTDPYGDDDVDIIVRADGSIDIGYHND